MITIWTQVTFIDETTPSVGGIKLYTDKENIKLSQLQLSALREQTNKWFDSLKSEEGKNVEIIKAK